MAVRNREIMLREQNIPDLLKSFPHWLVWKYERYEGDDPKAKPRKVPYYTTGRKRRGVLGSEADVSQLQDFDTALSAARDGFDGVGLAILPEQNITVLDIDDCISDTGEYSEFAQQVIDTGSYVERSPSNRGLRAVYVGSLIQDTKSNFHIENGERVEVYCGKAYTTFTGNKIKGIERNSIVSLPRDIKSVLKRGMELSGVNARAEGPGSSGDDGAGTLASMSATVMPNMTPAQALRVLQGLPERWGASGEGTWYQVAAALHLQFQDDLAAGYEVLDRWSSNREGYDPEGNAARWSAGFSHDRGKQNITTMRNLVFEARDAGVRFKQATLEAWGLRRAAEEKAAESDITLPEDELDGETAAAWVPVDISEWGTEERPSGAPALVKGWLYEGAVTLFSSHGGGGKSYVVLTFGAKAADPRGGHKWFGAAMVHGGVLYVNGEDPIVEVRHRLWGICASQGISMGEISGHLDIVDVTPVLHKALYTAGTDFGKTEFTKQYHKLKEMVESGKYKYLILDNLSKFYMANENARPMVDEFISALAALATAKGVGVLLVGHASKLGTDGYSGSTAWHNSARARWALNIKDGNRELMVEKNNYGETGHGGRWVWDDKWHVMGMQAAIGEGSAEEDFREQALLDGMREQVLELYSNGVSTPDNERGPLGAIEQNPWCLENDLHQKEIREILKRCVEVGLLGVEEHSDKRRPNRKSKRYCPLEKDLF